MLLFHISIGLAPRAKVLKYACLALVIVLPVATIRSSVSIESRATFILRIFRISQFLRIFWFLNNLFRLVFELNSFLCTINCVSFQTICKGFPSFDTGLNISYDSYSLATCQAGSVKDERLLDKQATSNTFLRCLRRARNSASGMFIRPSLAASRCLKDPKAKHMALQLSCLSCDL